MDQSNNELNSYYIKILDDFNRLETKQRDDASDLANDLTDLRLNICGIISANRTDDVKIESVVSAETNETPEGDESESQKPTATKTENTERLCIDLNAEDITIETVGNIAKLTAELSKNEECREALVDQNMFPSLTKCLKHPEMNDLARTQLCRALGNLCYYNNKARQDFLSCGLDDFYNLCQYCTTLDFTNSSDEDKKQKNTLITVALGCLHNLTNENETLKRAVYKLNVMELLKNFIPFLRNTNILVMYGSCLENLLELDEGKEQFVEAKLMLKLYEFMDTEFLLNLKDNTEDFFTTLDFLNDQKMSKVFLCQTDFIVRVVELMENKTTNNSDVLLRQMSLFLVSLVVKEEDPSALFSYKDMFILKKAIDWLCDEYRNEQLYVASAVVIANYLRNDESVQSLLTDKREPFVKILDILRTYQTSSSSTLQHINLIHSFLGSLRNFCVSPSFRTDLLKHPVIETVLPFVAYENLEVKAKALSIIRLLVKSCTEKTGLDLIYSEAALGDLEAITSGTCDHPTLVGESTRLICYLPIAARSENNVKKLSKFKFIEVIVNQLKSDHFIMVNEALLALNVLFTINFGEFRDQFKASAFNENLTALFHKETMPIEMQLNTLKLFTFLVDKNDIFTEEQLKEHLVSLKKLQTAKSSNPIMNSCLTQIIDKLENLTA